MFNLLTYLAQGLQNTLLMKNNSGFSFNGPYIRVEEETELDRWYLGDFVSADYTISIDLDQDNKELVKCSITAAVENANLIVYSRNYTNKSLVNLRVLVNDSYVVLYATPAFSTATGSKVIFTKQLFQNQTPLT